MHIAVILVQVLEGFSEFWVCSAISPHVSNLPPFTFSITCIPVYTRVFILLGEKFLLLFTPMDFLLL
jgi:hypothetical protein